MKTWEVNGGRYFTLCKDVSEQTHVLIGGTTGSGKSVFVKSFMYSMLALHSPATMQFVLIDCKGGVELGAYERLPHTIGFATETPEAEALLNRVVDTMEQRFATMKQEGKRETDESHIWIIIDETAVLLSESKAIDRLLSRIMRLGRAAHIHCLLCTQSPNRAKGGGLSPMICQNVTSAIALRCRSAVESRQIIGVSGAELLPQYGEGLYWSPTGIAKEAIPFVGDAELAERIKFWETQKENPLKKFWREVI